MRREERHEVRLVDEYVAVTLHEARLLVGVLVAKSVEHARAVEVRGRRLVEVDGLEVRADVVVVKDLRVPDDTAS